MMPMGKAHNPSFQLPPKKERKSRRRHRGHSKASTKDIQVRCESDGAILWPSHNPAFPGKGGAKDYSAGQPCYQIGSLGGEPSGPAVCFILSGDGNDNCSGDRKNIHTIHSIGKTDTLHRFFHPINFSTIRKLSKPISDTSCRSFLSSIFIFLCLQNQFPGAAKTVGVMLSPPIIRASSLTRSSCGRAWTVVNVRPS